MPSPQSLPSGDSAVRRERVIRLLQDGAVTVDPTPDVLAEAARLQALGVIQTSTSYFVRCSDPRDADFAESDHLCRGRIYVPEHLDDESPDDFCCPECDRPVFPVADEKQRHQELLCRIVPSGVFAYLKSLLKQAGLATTAVCEGVMRVDIGVLGVFVCVVDVCREPKFMSSAWVATQPTCYVLVNAKSARGHLVDERQLHHVLLANMICGDVDLVTAVRQAADSLSSVPIQHGVVPTHRRESTPSFATPKRLSMGEHRFEVALDHDTVWVEGVQVMGSRAGQRLVMFRLLWESFLEDLHCGKEPDEFRAYSLHAIRPLLESRLHKQYPDELTVRRMINRVQANLAKTMQRKLGLPIGREDIVETCAWKRQEATDFGYRLNPLCVVVATVPPRPRRTSS